MTYPNEFNVKALRLSLSKLCIGI